MLEPLLARSVAIADASGKKLLIGCADEFSCS